MKSVFEVHKTDSVLGQKAGGRNLWGATSHTWSVALPVRESPLCCTNNSFSCSDRWGKKCVWPEQTNMLAQWALHTLVSPAHSICPRQGVPPDQNIQRITHSCSPFLLSQHKLSGLKYAFQTYFIYIQKIHLLTNWIHSYDPQTSHHIQVANECSLPLSSESIPRHFRGSSQGKVWVGFFCSFLGPPASSPEYQNWRLTGSEASGLKMFKLILQPPPSAWWKQRFFTKVPPWVAQRTTKKVAFSSLTGFKSSIKPNLSAWHGGVLARKPQTGSWQLPRVDSGRWKGNVAENNGC